MPLTQADSDTERTYAVGGTTLPFWVKVAVGSDVSDFDFLSYWPLSLQGCSTIGMNSQQFDSVYVEEDDGEFEITN